MTQSGWYMASTGTIDEKYDGTMGIIAPMNTGQSPTSSIYRDRFSRGVPWCLDNGVFTNKFEFNQWIARIEALMEHKDTCQFVSIPDVVGNALSTLMEFRAYRDIVKKKFGLPVALVSQDNISNYADMIPWKELDCIFIGGSDNHKLGKEGGWILNAARKRNKWVHVGRVNSPKRIRDFWQADSWDGTHLGFMPSDVTKFHAAVLQVRAMKQSKGLFDDLHTSLPHGDYSRQSF